MIPYENMKDKELAMILRKETDNMPNQLNAISETLARLILKKKK